MRYEPRAALVGDRFCLDAALDGSWGHWDVEGRAPYLRWGLAGGVDYHSENVAAYSVSSGRIDRPLRDLMLQAHETMMAERPPQDGHRRTILDPLFTHVGIQDVLSDVFGFAGFGSEVPADEPEERITVSTRQLVESIRVPRREPPSQILVGSVATRDSVLPGGPLASRHPGQAHHPFSGRRSSAWASGGARSSS